MGADHPLPPECHDDQQRFEDAEFCRAPWKDWVDCKRRTAKGRLFQSVMVRGKNECFSSYWRFQTVTSVRTGNNINFFSLEALVNWEMIQRNAWKVIQRLVENRQTRVFATFEQGQPTKFVEQTSDRSCMAIIFFDKTGSTTCHHAKFHDNQLHCSWHICSQTQREKLTANLGLMSDKTLH